MEKVKRRNTATTQEVINILERSTAALSQPDIETMMTVDADRATIFRVLNRLVDDGLAHKVVSDEGKSYFARCHRCTSHHHHDAHFHFRCTNCQRVECIDGELKMKLPAGYTVQSTNLVLTGVCKACG